MALTSTQKRKAREKLARKRGVAASSISDADIQNAINVGVISSIDYGSASSYDCGASSSGSSFDSGSCF